MAILASLTALAAVNMAPAGDKMRVEAEARELANILSETRTRALTTGIPQSVVIDAAENRLVFGNPALERRLPATLVLDVAQNGEGRRIGRIVFYPEGGATAFRFVLAGRTHRLALSVDWLTGRISVGGGGAG